MRWSMNARDREQILDFARGIARGLGVTDPVTSPTFAIVQEVFAQGSAFGSSQVGAGKRVLIEYSSPNVAKELHIGHFRNTILGQSLNNIYQAAGFTTISVNHLGDWGTQFGMLLHGYKHMRNDEDFKRDPVRELARLYVAVRQQFRTLSVGDAGADKSNGDADSRCM